MKQPPIYEDRALQTFLLLYREFKGVLPIRYRYTHFPNVQCLNLYEMHVELPLASMILRIYLWKFSSYICINSHCNKSVRANNVLKAKISTCNIQQDSGPRTACAKNLIPWIYNGRSLQTHFMVSSSWIVMK